MMAMLPREFIEERGWIPRRTMPNPYVSGTRNGPPGVVRPTGPDPGERRSTSLAAREATASGATAPSP
jgi:hypothetical protein